MYSFFLVVGWVAKKIHIFFSSIIIIIIVKLHSELALPTESQLDRVGVDFVFPLSQVTKYRGATGYFTPGSMLLWTQDPTFPSEVC